MQVAIGLVLAISVAACAAAAALIFRRQLFFFATEQTGSFLRLVLLAALLASVPIALGWLLIRAGMRGLAPSGARWALLLIPVPLATAAFFVGGWLALYPDPADPKSFAYTLWKAGYRPMDLEDAIDAVIHDPDRDSVLIGKTEAELRVRFGIIGPLTADGRQCVVDTPWRDAKLLMLRDSPMAVAFKNGRSYDHVMLKDC